MPDLLARQDGWQVARSTGAHQLIEPREVDFENLSIKEKQCGKRLVLRRGRDLFLDGEVVEKLGNAVGAQVGRVPETVVPEETANPANIGALGPRAEVPQSTPFMDPSPEKGTPFLRGALWLLKTSFSHRMELKSRGGR